jgi:DNA-binding transcriptional ArsR family regulator
MELYDIKQINYEAQSKVMKALAHPSRLLIVHALMDHELCVCELRELLPHNLSTVSRHLSVLKNAGLLSEEKRGLYVYYKLTCPCINHFLSCVGQIVGEAGGQA